MWSCRQLNRNLEPPPASEFRDIKGYRKALLLVTEVTRSRVPKPLLTLHSYVTTYKPEK